MRACAALRSTGSLWAAAAAREYMHIRVGPNPMAAAREFMLAMREEDFFIVQDALVQHIGAARAPCSQPPFALDRSSDVVLPLQCITMHVCMHRHILKYMPRRVYMNSYSKCASLLALTCTWGVASPRLRRPSWRPQT
jgi:hypothetical protein